MIDEELYKIATDELNSDSRKPDVWARACALASDDHDEARFLYTNLRVEEMLNKDGKQRTFSTTRKSQDDNLSSADKLDTLELSLEDSTGLESGPTGISSSSAPLPIDDILGYDENDTNVPSSVAGNSQPTSSGSGFDVDTLAEIHALQKENNSTDGSLSSVTGLAVGDSAPIDGDLNDDSVVSDVVATSPDNTPASTQTPEGERTARLSKDLERQVDDLNHDDDAEPATSFDDETLVAQQETVRTDYADNDILADDQSLTDDGDLLTGSGRAYMVFKRDGTLKAIKRGVSWPALFFTFPWLISKALLGTAFIYACLWLVSLGGLLVTGSQWLSASPDATLGIKLWTAAFALLALIGLLYLPFRYGNRWLAEKLQNRGFELESAVSANSKRDAINRLLNVSR